MLFPRKHNLLRIINYFHHTKFKKILKNKKTLKRNYMWHKVLEKITVNIYQINYFKVEYITTATVCNDA